MYNAPAVLRLTTFPAFAFSKPAKAGGNAQRACELRKVPCNVRIRSLLRLCLRCPVLQANRRRLFGRTGDIPRLQPERNLPPLLSHFQCSDRRGLAVTYSRVFGLCFRKIYFSSRVQALRSVGLRIKPINKASVVGFWIFRFENSTIITTADFQEDADDLAQ